jgi:hypothetical protein
MIEKTVDKLRAKALNLYLEYESLIVFLNMMTVQLRKDFENSRKNIKSASKRELRGFINNITREIDNLRHEFGIKEENREFVDLLKRARAAGNKAYLVPKYSIAAACKHYERVFPRYSDIPDHANIEIDVGNFRSEPGTIEVHLLEAVLYENMSALFNLSRKSHLEITAKTSKKMIKTDSALCRATVLACFVFLESYLNGIAFDFYIRNKSNMSDEQKSILTEWDYKKGRAKYVSLREKLLHYPQILCGVRHPPFQEDNCTDLAFIVRRAKMLRDSIVHAAPAEPIENYKPDKQSPVFTIEYAEVEDVADAVIRLVKLIENRVHGGLNQIDWLHERNTRGYFPDGVFD